jgi:hypothetical protein
VQSILRRTNPFYACGDINLNDKYNQIMQNIFSNKMLAIIMPPKKWFLLMIHDFGKQFCHYNHQ